MMQSNSDFIPNFAKLAAPLRELTEKKRPIRMEQSTSNSLQSPDCQIQATHTA